MPGGFWVRSGSVLVPFRVRLRCVPGTLRLRSGSVLVSFRVRFGFVPGELRFKYKFSPNLYVKLCSVSKCHKNCRNVLCKYFALPLVKVNAVNLSKRTRFKIDLDHTWLGSSGSRVGLSLSSGTGTVTIMSDKI